MRATLGDTKQKPERRKRTKARLNKRCRAILLLRRVRLQPCTEKIRPKSRPSCRLQKQTGTCATTTSGIRSSKCRGGPWTRAGPRAALSEHRRAERVHDARVSRLRTQPNANRGARPRESRLLRAEVKVAPCRTSGRVTVTVIVILWGG